jgi:hypothetical protein
VLPRPEFWFARLTDGMSCAYACCLAFATLEAEEVSVSSIVLLTHHSSCISFARQVLFGILSTYATQFHAQDQLATPQHLSNVALEDVPLEAFIVALLTECPAPAPGSTISMPLPLACPPLGFHTVVTPKLKGMLPPRSLLPPLHITAPASPSAPILDPACATELLRSVSPDAILRTLAGLLAARSTVLVSSSRWRLGACSEALKALMFPVEWVGIELAVLSNHTMQMLDAPVPSFCGVLRGDAEASGYGKALHTSLVLDLDDGSMRFPRHTQSQQDALTDLQRQLRRGGRSSRSIDPTSSQEDADDQLYPRFPRAVAAPVIAALTRAAHMVGKTWHLTDSASSASDEAATHDEDEAVVVEDGSESLMLERMSLQAPQTGADGCIRAVSSLPGVMSILTSDISVPKTWTPTKDDPPTDLRDDAPVANEAIACYAMRCAVLEAMVAVFGGYHRFFSFKGADSPSTSLGRENEARFLVGDFLASRTAETRPLATAVVSHQPWVYLCQHTLAAVSSFSAAQGTHSDADMSAVPMTAEEAAIHNAPLPQQGVFVFLAAQAALAHSLHQTSLHQDTHGPLRAARSTNAILPPREGAPRELRRAESLGVTGSSMEHTSSLETEPEPSSKPSPGSPSPRRKQGWPGLLPLLRGLIGGVQDDPRASPAHADDLSPAAGRPHEFDPQDDGFPAGSGEAWDVLGWSPATDARASTAVAQAAFGLSKRLVRERVLMPAMYGRIDTPTRQLGRVRVRPVRLLARVAARQTLYCIPTIDPAVVPASKPLYSALGGMVHSAAEEAFTQTPRNNASKLRKMASRMSFNTPPGTHASQRGVTSLELGTSPLLTAQYPYRSIPSLGSALGAIESAESMDLRLPSERHHRSVSHSLLPKDPSLRHARSAHLALAASAGSKSPRGHFDESWLTPGFKAAQELRALAEQGRGDELVARAKELAGDLSKPLPSSHESGSEDPPLHKSRLATLADIGALPDDVGKWETAPLPDGDLESLTELRHQVALELRAAMQGRALAAAVAKNSARYHHPTHSQMLTGPHEQYMSSSAADNHRLASKQRMQELRGGSTRALSKALRGQLARQGFRVAKSAAHPDEVGLDVMGGVAAASAVVAARGRGHGRSRSEHRIRLKLSGHSRLHDDEDDEESSSLGGESFSSWGIVPQWRSVSVGAVAAPFARELLHRVRSSADAEIRGLRRMLKDSMRAVRAMQLQVSRVLGDLGEERARSDGWMQRWVWATRRAIRMELERDDALHELEWTQSQVLTFDQSLSKATEALERERATVERLEASLASVTSRKPSIERDSALMRNAEDILRQDSSPVTPLALPVVLGLLKDSVRACQRITDESLALSDDVSQGEDSVFLENAELASRMASTAERVVAAATLCWEQWSAAKFEVVELQRWVQDEQEARQRACSLLGELGQAVGLLTDSVKRMAASDSPRAEGSVSPMMLRKLAASICASAEHSKGRAANRMSQLQGVMQKPEGRAVLARWKPPSTTLERETHALAKDSQLPLAGPRSAPLWSRKVAGVAHLIHSSRLELLNEALLLQCRIAHLDSAEAGVASASFREIEAVAARLPRTNRIQRPSPADLTPAPTSDPPIAATPSPVKRHETSDPPPGAPIATAAAGEWSSILDGLADVEAQLRVMEVV